MINHLCKNIIIKQTSNHDWVIPYDKIEKSYQAAPAKWEWRDLSQYLNYPTDAVPMF